MMARFATGQEIARGNFFKVRKKSGNFSLSQGKLKSTNTVDLLYH